MCGINGLLVAPGHSTAPLQARIAAMNRALLHRGPDAEGQWFGPANGPSVALGFRRLAIVDLTPAGGQPMSNEDGTLWGVFNGEVYNHVELAVELRARGHVLRSRCDAEVVLHAFEAWGEDCLQRFNGMFAFAVWDTRTQRLFAARDRFGVKPLLYVQQQHELLFSSEVAGLRAALPLARAHGGKLHDYLAYGYRSNDGQTFFDGVRELPPGHCMTWQSGRLDIRRWWQLPHDAPPPAGTETAVVRDLLTDAVRLRLRADVPVALLQSGGLDSSILCSIVDDQIAAGRLEAGSVTAFTAVHPGDALDESAQVQRLMQRCPHIRPVLLEPAHGELAARLPAFVQAMQEPLFSATAYAHWGLMQAVHERGVKVMINGQGADEGFAGYGRYIAGYRLLDLLLSAPGQLPAEMRAIARQQGQGVPTQLVQLAKAMLGRRAASRWRGSVSEGGARLLSPDFRATHHDHLRELGMVWSAGNLDAHLRAQLEHYGFNQILQYEDLSAMNQSIEMRSPFVDWRVMSLAFALPMSARFAGGITKRVLREAFADRLPSEIVHEPRKIGFATPFARWAQAPSFKAFVHELVSAPEFLRRPIWNGPRLADALTGRRPVPADFPAWRFISAELWLRGFGLEVA